MVTWVSSTESRSSLTPVFPAAAICLSPAAGSSVLEKTSLSLSQKPPAFFSFLPLPPSSPSLHNSQFLPLSTPLFMAAPPLPPWLSSPSVTLSLSTSTLNPPPQSPSPSPQLHIENLSDCCRDLEDNLSALSAHKKEATWHLRRLEQQLEAQKACRRRETMEEVEAKVRKLREDQALALERIDAEYKEQLMVLTRDAEAKEQKLVEQWAAKHAKVTRLIQQMGCCRR